MSSRSRLATLIGQRGTLTRQLVTRVALVVAVIVLVLSSLLTFTVHRLLTDQLDRQLGAALALQLQDPRRGFENSGRPRGVNTPGMPFGTLIVQQIDATTYQAGQVQRGRAVTLDIETVHKLVTVPTDQGPTTIDVPGYGTFRAAARAQNGSLSVVAIPVDDLNHVNRAILIAELVLGVVSIVAAMLIAGALVQRTLRPMNRIADAARQVSQLELSTGEVAVPIRVDTSGLPSTNEMAEVGNSFNHMLNNVEDALAARQASEVKVRQFVADASHELRNPLAAIRGYAELTTKHADGLPDDTAHALARIDAESGRMAKLVNDLLLLARLDSEPELRLAPVDVTEVVLNAVSDARAASHDHVWKLDVPDQPMMVAGEPDRLHQVVANLLTNARAHTPSGTTVTTTVRREDDSVIVLVADDGPGISPELQQVVFERFARGDSMRTHNPAESTGLGLSIVSAVVGAHGGRVWVTSRPGHTEFAVVLPAVSSSRTSTN